MPPDSKRGLVAVLAAAVHLGACATPPAAQPASTLTRIPATRVSVPAPPGFEMSYQFPGLIDPQTFASVMVAEIPQAASVVLEGMNAAALAARGAELLETESLRVDGRAAWVLHAQSAGTSDRGSSRWILVTGEGETSAVVSATVPRSLAERLGPGLREMLLAVVWEPDRVLSPYDGLGFEIDETDALKRSDRLPRMVSFTRDGHQGALAPEDPLFLAGVSLAPPASADLGAFSHRQLQGTVELDAIVVLSETALELDGLQAYEILATAVDGQSGAPLQIYQLLVVDGEQYFPLQGLVGAELAVEFIPQFRSIAHSFRRARPPDGR